MTEVEAKVVSTGCPATRLRFRRARRGHPARRAPEYGSIRTGMSRPYGRCSTSIRFEYRGG
jgi:hypothetical protein